MGDDAQRFATEASGVRSADGVETGEFLHVYRGQSRETDDQNVRFLSLSPTVTDAAVVDAFTRAAGQWQNPSTHPNIVSVYDRGTTPRPWIAVEEVTGQSLTAVQSNLSLVEARTVVVDTAEALRNAGLYNTMHLSLSPADVWVVRSDTGVVGVVDGWGVEQACRVAAGDWTPTPFTAPELLDDPARATEQTDVYGLGALAYYALTSRPPISDTGAIETALRDGAVTPPSELDPELPAAIDEVLLQSLNSAPADRQESVYAFKTAFESALPAQEHTSTSRAEANQDGQTDREEKSSGEMSAISGVGATRAAAFRQAGYETVKDIAAADQSELTAVEGIGTTLAERIKADSHVQQIVDDAQNGSTATPTRESASGQHQQQADQHATENTPPNTLWFGLVVLGTIAWWGGMAAGVFVFPEGTAAYERTIDLAVLAWFVVPSALYLDSRTVRKHIEWKIHRILYIIGALSIVGTGLTGLVYIRRRRSAGKQSSEN